jgi:hypothetical protein
MEPVGSKEVEQQCLYGPVTRTLEIEMDEETISPSNELSVLNPSKLFLINRRMSSP